VAEVRPGFLRDGPELLRLYLFYMKQVILELDEQTARDLERVAPSKQRKRSAFLRAAVRRAIDDTLERRTEAAYRRMPDSGEPWYFDPDAWSKAPVKRRRKR
jgi:hypothetical protein